MNGCRIFDRLDDLALELLHLPASVTDAFRDIGPRNQYRPQPLALAGKSRIMSPEPSAPSKKQPPPKQKTINRSASRQRRRPGRKESQASTESVYSPPDSVFFCVFHDFPNRESRLAGRIAGMKASVRAVISKRPRPSAAWWRQRGNRKSGVERLTGAG